MACSVHRSANDGTLFDGAEFVSEISSLENARALELCLLRLGPEAACCMGA